MKLWGMLEAYNGQNASDGYLSMSFDERISLIVDNEYFRRKNRSLARHLVSSKLRYSDACVENIDFTTPRGLDRFTVLQLVNCHWIQQHRNVLISGATGTGKTFLACALGNAACRNSVSTKYFRLPKLLSDISISKGNGSYPKFFLSLEKSKLLIIDDFGLQNLNNLEARELLEIIESRTNKASLIISSQLPVGKWYETISDPTLADAIIDRIIHNSVKINLAGESMRKLKANIPILQDDVQ